MLLKVAERVRCWGRLGGGRTGEVYVIAKMESYEEYGTPSVYQSWRDIKESEKEWMLLVSLLKYFLQ